MLLLLFAYCRVFITMQSATKRTEKSKLKCETSRQYDIHYLPVGGDKLEQRRKTLAKKFK